MKFDEAMREAIHLAERLYDQVIRRWGNVHYARSSVYDWVWSEEFLQLYCSLNEVEQGQLRISVLRRFHVKPWPWYSPHSQEPPFER